MHYSTATDWGTQLGADIADPGLGEEVARGRIFVLLEYLKSIQRPGSPNQASE